jgi:hypothetical protein
MKYSEIAWQRNKSWTQRGRENGTDHFKQTHANQGAGKAGSQRLPRPKLFHSLLSIFFAEREQRVLRSSRKSDECERPANVQRTIRQVTNPLRLQTVRERLSKQYGVPKSSQEEVEERGNACKNETDDEAAISFFPRESRWFQADGVDARPINGYHSMLNILHQC